MVMRRIAAYVFAFTAVIAVAPAAAPQISIQKPYVETTVTVDPALKQFADLFANCLAEGKAWADRVTNDATAQWHSDRSAFRDGMKWSEDREYALRSVVGPYVSVVRSDGTFEGGAHPNQEIDTILWSNTARKRTNIRPFFNETADNGPTMTALAQLARLAVAAEKLSKGINGYDDDDIPADKLTPEQEIKRDNFVAQGVQPALLRLGPVTLAPSTDAGKSAGLTFHYSPYAVGPYVEGPHTVFVPWTAFAQYLSDEGKQLFGGTRPPNDAEKWD